VPSGTAISVASVMVLMVSAIVGSMRSAISIDTGRL